jgi:YihY family inner membrane protein
MNKITKRVTGILHLAARKFFLIDGGQRAAAFAFYAFLSLFPLIILLVTVASAFLSPDKASQYIFAYIGNYVPLSDEIKRHIFNTIYGVIKAHKQVGVIAFIGLVWGSMQFLSALIRATNRAWDAHIYRWWKLPLKSLTLLSILFNAIFLGIVAPILARMTKEWLFPANAFFSWAYGLVVFFIPLLVLFFSLTLFYKLAPLRRIRFAETWPSALFVTVLFLSVQSLFVFFMKNFFHVNAVYGAFGEVIAFLLWIYLSGCIFIFGACLCAGHSEHK